MGIGIDEVIVIIVNEEKVWVVGRGVVYFYDVKWERIEGEFDYVFVYWEGIYDFVVREIFVVGKDFNILLGEEEELCLCLLRLLKWIE